ncbi:MAG: glycosyltransferase family 4 protein [Nitrospira sp. CG24E]|nr:MAG: glycosyltransferase family 4 protein [Nitrospira sp. CG24E]
MGKKVLLIAYHYPPSVEVGGLRCSNFSRHLPRFGWTPYVLTLKDEYLDKADPEKLNYVGDVEIFKAGRMLTLSHVYVGIKRMAQRLFRKTNEPGTPSDSDAGVGESSSRVAETWPQKLRRYILSFLSLPDEQRNWALPAVIQGIRIIQREKIDCIFTSSPPYSVNLVGWLLKAITGVRWIADFRDPWMTGGSKKLYMTCAASLGIERWLERRVIQKADLIVANTEMLCEAFKKAYGSQLPDRFVCITNGFDGELFSSFGPVEKEKVFTITYTGTLYFGRTPEPLFQAVRELIQEKRIDAQAIRIRLVGHCQFISGRSTGEIVQAYQLEGIVEVLDPVSYNRAIEMVRQSQLALLLAPNQPYQVPAKAYDYMGTGTKILALAEDGATCDLVRSTGIGAAFRPSDTAGIKEFLLRSMKQDCVSIQSKNNGPVSEYEIQALTRRLARYLDSFSSPAVSAERVGGSGNAA